MMSLLDVTVGDLQVAVDHFQGRVTQDLLECVNVAAIAKVLDGEGVAKSVRVGVANVGPLGDAFDEFEQGVAGHRAIVDVEKDVLSSIRALLGLVFPDGAAGVGAERDDPLLRAFAQHFCRTIADVDIVPG